MDYYYYYYYYLWAIRKSFGNFLIYKSYSFFTISPQNSKE